MCNTQKKKKSYDSLVELEFGIRRDTETMRLSNKLDYF